MTGLATEKASCTTNVLVSPRLPLLTNLEAAAFVHSLQVSNVSISPDGDPLTL